MNTNLLTIVQQITGQYGETVLGEPRRVSALFGDLARDIPAPQRNAFVKCLEHKFTEMLKNVSEADRGDCKQGLAQRLNENEGLDPRLCRDTVELLATALFGPQPQEEIQASAQPSTTSSAASDTLKPSAKKEGQAAYEHAPGYIDLDDFIMQKDSLPNGKKFKSVAVFSKFWRYWSEFLLNAKSSNGKAISFNADGFDTRQLPKGLKEGQIVIVSYTTGKYNPRLKALEVAPPPATEEIEELDLAAFIAQANSHPLEKRFKSFGLYHEVSNQPALIDTGGNTVLIDKLFLDGGQMPANLQKGQKVIVTYSKIRNPVEGKSARIALYSIYVAPPAAEEIEELDLAAFKAQANSHPLGKRFKSFGLYHEVSNKPALIDTGGNTVFIEKLLLDGGQMPANLQEGQKVIVTYSKTAIHTANITLHSIEEVQAPEIPEGYEEIDLGDFMFDFARGNFEPGRKFCSRANFRMIHQAVSALFSPLDDQNAFQLFYLTKRLPKLVRGQLVTILFTISTDILRKDAYGKDSKVPDLDDVLV